MSARIASLPIRSKLMLLACVTSGVALLIAGGIHAYNDYRSGRYQLVHRLQTQAEVTALNSAAAVTFDDAKAAGGMLDALRADPAIVRAAIVHADGSPFVSRDLAAKRAPRNTGVRAQADIVLDERIGRVELSASTAELSSELRRDLWITLATLVGALSVALLAASWLQRFVSGPILALAKATRAVSEDGDYSVRVAQGGSDEVGRLVESFNGMIEQIAERDRQLRDYHVQLEQKVAERTAELAAALKDAQAAARAKAEFLANMSHEIRTPMNGVIGMLDLLEAGRLEPQERGMLDTARNSADALLAVINDVLDFSKIDAGRLVLEDIEIELRPLVEEVATLFSLQAHKKGIELSCFIHCDVPGVVRGDPTRLRQVLANLTSNAVKFTSQGEVFIGLRARQPEAPTESGRALTHIEIEVRDTGIGMSPEVLRSLFQAFTQADSSTTRRFGGTGLGLTIAKRLVEAMHGTLTVRSEPGKGSTFVLDVPLLAVSPADVRGRRDLHGMRALVVDDNATNRAILEHYLSTAGIQFTSAPSASAGREAAHAAAAKGECFDVAVLDYQMPDVDGLGLVADLRKDARTAALPCVVLSSLGDRSGVDNTDGVAAWLGKPVRQSALLRVLGSVAGRAADRDSSAAVARVPAPTPARREFRDARVLLAEDNEVNQQVARRVLASFGITTRIAVNGEDAVEQVRSGHFDLVLMDCQMPVMDGYAATEAIREWEQVEGRARTPIIAVTANAMSGDREKCLAAGMDDYLSKPFKRDALGVVLGRWLMSLRESA
jgi:signal transduction histidine kinase/DNA-binding response OmpR family regulator